LIGIDATCLPAKIDALVGEQIEEGAKASGARILWVAKRAKFGVNNVREALGSGRATNCGELDRGFMENPQLLSC
jgi:hypothetical protein